MEKKSITINLSILLACLICVIILYNKGCEKQDIVVHLPDYKTDTIKVDSIILDTIKEPFYIKPDIVYVDTSIPIYLPGKDKIIRQTDTTFIPLELRGYGIQYLGLTGDSLFIAYGLNLDTLEFAQSFPVKYKQFRYEYFEGQLRAKALSQKELRYKPKLFKIQSSAYASYNPLDRTPRLALDYSIIYKERLGIFGLGAIHGRKVQPAELQLGIIYRIK